VPLLLPMSNTRPQCGIDLEGQKISIFMSSSDFFCNLCWILRYSIVKAIGNAN
jgi:hypothetical protein